MQHPSPTPEVPTILPPAQPPSHEGRAAWWTFVILAALLLPLFVLASFDFGATWDEKARHRYGEIILEYFRGLRSRSSFIQDEGGLYGGLFDTICAVVEQWVPANRYVLRTSSIFGWIGVVLRASGRASVGRWSGLAMISASSPR
jgi:hypothetical protein